MMDDMDLDGLLAQAAKRQPSASDALLARIEADALRLQPKAAMAAAPPKRGFWGWLDLFGGSGGVAGLGLAAASGLWLGVAQPSMLGGVTDYLTGTAAVELLPSDATLYAGE